MKDYEAKAIRVLRGENQLTFKLISQRRFVRTLVKKLIDVKLDGSDERIRNEFGRQFIQDSRLEKLNIIPPIKLLKLVYGDKYRIYDLKAELRSYPSLLSLSNRLYEIACRYYDGDIYNLERNYTLQELHRLGISPNYNSEWYINKAVMLLKKKQKMSACA